MSDCFVVDVIQDIADISALVNSYFNDEKKTTIWLNAKNPLLGNTAPIGMIFERRTEKLIEFIKSQLGDNIS